MYNWSRDSGFYKTPAVKVLLVWTSASSFVYRILAVRQSHPVVLWLFRVCAVPTPGMWLAVAMILHSCRVLERQIGTRKFTDFLWSSVLLGVGVAVVLQLPPPTFPLSLDVRTSYGGLLVHMLAGALVVQYMRSVVPLHSYRLLGIPFSSNLIFYFLVAMFSGTSQPSAIAALCGVIGGVATIATGVSLLPPLPQWVGGTLMKLHPQDHPPPRLTGASLEVQRSQRMDQIENLMANMYTRRRAQRPSIRVLHRPHALAPPSEHQIQQLTTMGFSHNDAYQALLNTGSNTTAAIQLLTARNAAPH